MSIEIKVPQMGESVVEATVGEWLKKEGDTVNLGDVLVELETDKVDVEVGAESSGVLGKILVASGEDVQVGDVLGVIEPNGSAAPSEAKAEPEKAAAPAEAQETAVKEPTEKITPVAQRMASEEGVDVTKSEGQRPRRQGDQKRCGQTAGIGQNGVQCRQTGRHPAPPTTPAPTPSRTADPREERVKMSRRRRTIAARLVEAQQTAAMLTTFNEIDMSAVMELRKRRQDAFVQRHGVKIGFTSFFVKATVGALKAFPRLNAEIDGDEMVLKSYYDIGIAVGAEEGLVVPVLRDADRMSFAQIEQQTKSLLENRRMANYRWRICAAARLPSPTAVCLARC
jgi:2-oxoglutarate dehydrogenase E2 component (dihydrolipoamide succinyltransferase)